MSPAISLEHLQSLLQDEEERERILPNEAEKQFQHLASSIDAVWRHVGVLPGSNAAYWTRPAGSSLYSCPLSQPQTTLVPWKHLPANEQAKVRSICTNVAPPASGLGHDTGPEVVEVPLACLGGVGESGQDATRVRPIRGNLSDKLSEYTRGMAGQRSRPFRPGGLEETVVGDKEDPYRTPDAIQRSIKVLEQGSEASWNDGSLITAPPGVDFKVGLSWTDVYGLNSAASNKIDFHTEEERAAGNSGSEGTHQLTILSGATPSQGVFNRSYFDDDSLFGSSSSESDDGDSYESDHDNGRKTEQNEGDKDEFFLSGSDPAKLKEKSITSNDATDAAFDVNEKVDIDQLLMDLTISDKELFTKKTRDAGAIMSNPLELAETQSKNQNDPARKSWATDKLLPIHDFNSLIPNPALTFPFTLDDFQQQAVARLERSESVFVAAHTSAGKTVVAEYAVALAKQRATRCIYTSPIKALSNQKFRDFCRKFGSETVGLMTGDMQVNVEDSTCLIMTTEILRSMLYRGADLIRDIEFVVFDEVHYVNDTERGVVWEEVIIMIPTNVNLIFLSATTPNTFEFSDWIGRTKRKVVHVIKTDYRPVPLSHFLWAGTQLHKVLQGNGSFIEKGYVDATNALLPASSNDPSTKKGDQKGRSAAGSKQLAWQAIGNKPNWVSLVRFLDRELLTPAVVFSFSKKKCEEIANMLRSIDLNSAKERSAILGFTMQTTARLSQNDSQLPQVLILCEMVVRGIGVHHGGLLPILKEMVEILFSRNLIKILFATETFAMGVNMPAKAVVFNSIRKHDGNQFRVLEPGEYTQMAGRAGRRGLDKVGTVILCCFGETPPPQPMLRHLLTGTSTRLSSQFRLKYGMILNLLKSEAELSVEAMIKRSFSEFATQRALTANEYPQLLERGVRTLDKLERQFENDAASRIGLEDIEAYFSVCSDLLATTKVVLSYIRQSDVTSFDDLFQTGRIVFVSAARLYGVVRAPAIVLRAPTASLTVEAPSQGNASQSDTMVCLVLMPSSFLMEEDDAYSSPKPFGSIGYVGFARQRHFSIREISLDQVLMIAGGKRRKIVASAILQSDEKNYGRMSLGSRDMLPGPVSSASDPFAGMKAFGKKGDDESSKPVSGAAKRDDVIDQALGYLLDAEKAELREAGVPTMDLQNLVKRGSDLVEYRKLCDELESLTLDMRSFASHRHPALEKFYSSIERKAALRAKVEKLRHLLSNESLQLFPDFLQRKAVLTKLGYVDGNEIVSVKGRVACEVNTCEEILMTEMVFEGLFNDLEPEEVVAVLSALVYQEKNSEEFDSELPEKLVSCCMRMKIIATNLGQLQKECGLAIDPGEYCDNSLKFGLVHVVYEWALGVPFKNICELTDAHEGSIVRCITRLDELCREVRNCARVVGNPTLYRKLEAASAAIKRDIVFASSLYVS